MKKKEPRWYLLWFITSGMWLISFCINLYDGRIDILVLQFLNILISLAAGIVNARRYKNRYADEDENCK